MSFTKLFDSVTPLKLIALAGVIMIGNGIIHTGRENYALQYIIGAPIALGAAGFRCLIRRIVNYNMSNMWIIEAIIAGFLVYACPKM